MPRGKYDRGSKSKPQLLTGHSSPGEMTSVAAESLRLVKASLEERVLESQRKMEWHTKNSEAYPLLLGWPAGFPA